ncbi:MAG TPA: hypothetical protein VGU27_04520 [Candidatus Eisenbacteria bacterium]|nr:hypothetical protein [Candidatus Eisenbacteria bacterium]
MKRTAFFVSAALGVLVCALHLTGGSARGQGASALVAMTAEAGPVFAVDSAGNIYRSDGCQAPFVAIGRIPAGHSPTCMGAWSNGQNIFVGCSDGDVYSFAPFAAPGFIAGLCGNALAGSPTAVGRATWGSLKARYR